MSQKFWDRRLSHFFNPVTDFKKSTHAPCTAPCKTSADTEEASAVCSGPNRCRIQEIARTDSLRKREWNVWNSNIWEYLRDQQSRERENIKIYFFLYLPSWCFACIWQILCKKFIGKIIMIMKLENLLCITNQFSVFYMNTLAPITSWYDGKSRN